MLKMEDNSKIIDILEERPFACNYEFSPQSYVAEPNAFNNYYFCRRPLYFQLGNLRFCSKCKIVLKKAQYTRIKNFFASK